VHVPVVGVVMLDCYPREPGSQVLLHLRHHLSRMLAEVNSFHVVRAQYQPPVQPILCHDPVAGPARNIHPFVLSVESRFLVALLMAVALL